MEKENHLQAQQSELELRLGQAKDQKVCTDFAIKYKVIMVLINSTFLEFSANSRACHENVQGIGAKTARKAAKSSRELH